MAGGGNCGSKNEGPPIDNDLALRRAIELQQQNKGEIVIINTGRKRFVELGTLARIVYLYLIVCHFLMLFFNIVISLVSIFRKSKYQIISDRHFYWLHFLYTIGVGCWWGFMVTGFLRRKDNLLLFTTLSVLALFFILIDFLFDLRLIYHAVRQDFTGKLPRNTSFTLFIIFYDVVNLLIEFSLP